MFDADNPMQIRLGTVVFAPMTLMNAAAGSAYCPGHPSIIGKRKLEPVSKAPLEMIVR